MFKKKFNFINFYSKFVGIKSKLNLESNGLSLLFRTLTYLSADPLINTAVFVSSLLRVNSFKLEIKML